MSHSLWPHGLRHNRLLCPSLPPGVCSNSRPLSWWCYLTISSSAIPFSFCLKSFPVSGLFQWVSSSHQVAKVLELQCQSLQWIFRVDFLSGWLIWSPCCQRDYQEPSPAPQFKSIDSSALRLLYGTTLTYVCDYWKNHRFDYVDLHQQSNVSAL